MTPKKTEWKPEDEDALKALIRETIKGAGPIDPAVIPSKVKERIRGRAAGDLDIDAYIRDVISELQKPE